MNETIIMIRLIENVDVLSVLTQQTKVGKHERREKNNLFQALR